MGEFQWGELWLHPVLGPAASQVRVPSIRYSGLIGGHVPSLEQVGRLEVWLSISLSDVLAIRVDELLRLDWESDSGHEWWQWPDPVQALRNWLLATGQDARYFRLLPNEERHAGPNAAADGGA